MAGWGRSVAAKSRAGSSARSLRVMAFFGELILLLEERNFFRQAILPLFYGEGAVDV